MNYRIVSKFLGIISLLIAVTMLFSLPWAYPSWGKRATTNVARSVAGETLSDTQSSSRNSSSVEQFESRGFYALCESILISAAVGLLLIGIGGKTKAKLFQKEALAVVGFAWILATILGGLPFYLSGTYRGPSVRLDASQRHLYHHDNGWLKTTHWRAVYDMPEDHVEAIRFLVEAGAAGVALDDVPKRHLVSLETIMQSERPIAKLIAMPGSKVGPNQETNREPNAQTDQRVYLRWVQMTFIDAMFESQSGFSTTGATVISDLENPDLVPHCILFWRSSTHFLGGLGIIVLFVAIAGQGSAGKALMRNEVPGPSQESSEARMQHTAQVFTAIYVGLTITLSILLRFCGLSWFDAVCHAFGTMATGGFSTYNASLGHFDSALIDGVVIVFMLMAGMNFTLLYFLLRGVPSTMWNDIEWRTYIGIILVVTAIVVGAGMLLGEFPNDEGQVSLFSAIRYGLFQVVSIITTTGYGTHDFNAWNQLSRCMLLLLMFVGGCAGSTGGGVKVIRWVLMTKILGIELERTHHPRVVRTLRLGGKAIDDSLLRNNIFVYFVIIAAIFLVSWLILVGVEPNATWSGHEQHKLIDSASAVAATLNNIGPGLGTVGATQNYGHFSATSKALFTLLMMLGRVEVFAILVLLMPSFWRMR